MHFKNHNENDVNNINANTSDDELISMNHNILKQLSKTALSFFKYIGKTTIVTFKSIFLMIKKFIRLSKQKYKQNKKGNRPSVIIKALKKFANYIKHSFYRFFMFFACAGKALVNAYRSQSNFFKKIASIFKVFALGCKNNKQIFKTAFNYLLPAGAIVAFVFLVNFVFTLTFAVKVKYNNVEVGFVQNEIVFDEAEQKLRSRMIYKESDDEIQAIPVLKVEVVPKSKLLSAGELTDTMIMSMNQDIIEAEGITIDGVFLGATKEIGAIDKVLNSIIDSKRTGNANEQVKFTKEIIVETGLFITQNIKDLSDMTNLLTSSYNSDAYYQIEPNDTPILIAEKNNISLDELMALNPTVLKKCLIGDNVLINKSKPFLPVSITKIETYTIAVPFTTQTITSAQYANGYTKINKAGQNGESIVTANVEYIDGIEAKRTVTNTQVVKESITQQVVKGTGYFGTSSNNNAPYTGKLANGKFIWPVSGGYISQYYSGYHRAIDYAGRGNIRGNPIYASDDGKVIFAGWAGSYGKMVKIDHGNGFVTLYAHCDDISPVNVGKTVRQGEIIAKVGSTGYVVGRTGVHLHFEIIQNGVQKNPLNYLP